MKWRILVCGAAALHVLAVSASILWADPATFDPGGISALQLAPLAQRAAKPADVAVAVWPTGVIDAHRTHHLTANAPTIVIFAVANPNGRDLKRGALSIDLPTGVNVLGANGYLAWHLRTTEKITRDGQSYVRITCPVSVHPTTIPRGPHRNSYFARYRPPAVWLTTTLAAGVRPGKLYVRFLYTEDAAAKAGTSVIEGLAAAETPKQLDALMAGTSAIDGLTAAPESDVDLLISPPLAAQQPRFARSGVMGRFILNGNADIGDPLGTYWRQLGYNFIVRGPRITKPIAGVDHWVEAPVQNAFEVAGATEVPEDLRFVAEGKALPRVVTPAAIYRQDEWVRANVFTQFDRLIAGEIDQYKIFNHATCFLINWEPYRYMTGDQSPRNRAEFVTWSKLAAADVEAVWPEQVAAKYPEQWRNFLNWQLGQVMQTLTSYVHAAGEKAGVKARLGIWCSNDAIYAEGADPIRILEWGDMPLDVVTWQYFYVPNARGPFPIIDRMGAPQVVRSARVASWTDERLGGARQIRVGCLYGWEQTSGSDGYFFPEQVAFLHLSGIFTGSEVVQNYAEYPIWDGRYAAEMAAANTRIARWDDFIINGRMVRQHVAIPVSPYPQQVAQDVTPAQQELVSEWLHPDYLYTFGYEKDGKRLITMANTWDYADVFVRLRVLGLDPAQRYHLSEPEQNRLFVTERGTAALTAADLEQGLVVHVGAMRWGAFLVEPAGATELRLVPPQAVQEAMTARRTTHQDAVEQDSRRYRQDFATATPGILGQGVHGELVVDGRIQIGYVGQRTASAKLHAAVVDRKGDHAMRLFDDDGRASVYVAIHEVLPAGTWDFDLTVERVAPMSISLGNDTAVLTVPTAAQWQAWFGTPYQANWVYLESKGGDPKALRPIDTGVAVAAGKTYQMQWTWDAQNSVTITANGEPIVSNAGMLNAAAGVSSFRWLTTAYSGTLDDNAVFLIDRIKVMAPQH